MAQNSGSARSSASATRNGVEEELSELFLRFSPEEHNIKGFAGKWTFYTAESDEDSGITSEFRCLRTYDLLPSASDEIGDAVSKKDVRFQTFNEFEPTNGKARKRSIDGIFESSHLRASTDLFFSNNTSLSEADKQEGFPECVYWRSAALDNEHVMRIAPNLPPNPIATELEDKYPNWTAHNGPAGVFAFEAFLMVGEDRWSLGALYSLQDLTLISHFCICERLTTINPAQAMNFDKFNYRTPAGRYQFGLIFIYDGLHHEYLDHLDYGVRFGGQLYSMKCRLPADPKAWLSTGEYRGEMSELIWDEDGEAMKLPTRPTNYVPPNTQSPDHRLFLYNDSCYAFYPKKLPEVHANSDKQFGEGARFEMGLLHKDAKGDQNTFRRLILRYSESGTAVSLTKELFKSEGSFDFDRRQSQSVRRSFGSRRAASSRFDVSPGHARSANQRAARLREAFVRAESETELQYALPAGSTGSLPRMHSGGSDTLDNATISRIMEQHSRART